MDTSETYIKMCEKAEEIQEGWQPQAGDWFYKRDGVGYGLWLIADIMTYGEEPYQDIVLCCSGERIHSAPFVGELVEFRDQENYIWLPRQDQLQEMLTNYGNDRWMMICDFSAWCQVQEMGYSLRDYKSMEQLWLAFVQKEKYGKVWNGENWVKEE